MAEQRCVREVLAEVRDLVETVEANLSCGKVGLLGAEMEADLERAMANLVEAQERIHAKRLEWAAPRV